MKEVYDRLSPWETVQVARHKDRPHTSDYLGLVFDEFVELHGDRLFGDDRAVISRVRQTGSAQGDGDRPRERALVQGTHRVLFRLRASGRLSQSDGQDAAGGQVRTCR